MRGGSVTRQLDFFNIWPFRAITICSKHFIKVLLKQVQLVAKYKIKPSKSVESLLKFHQSGEKLQNLVTLMRGIEVHWVKPYVHKIKSSEAFDLFASKNSFPSLKRSNWTVSCNVNARKS